MLIHLVLPFLARIGRLPFLLSQAVAVSLAVLLVACAAPTEEARLTELSSYSDAIASLDQLMLVDCALPGQVRRLGTALTFIAPRRMVKTTQRDCGIRGGEYVLFDRSDYGSALATLRPEAEAGDPVAQTYVGEIYEKGLGLPAPEYAKAAHWYRLAADQGHQPAQTSLGALYEQGLGVAKDKLMALDLYRRAAGIGDDGLAFKSVLDAERAAFRRELDLRNELADSLRKQLETTRSRLGETSVDDTSVDDRQAAQVEALKARLADQERALIAQRRDAESMAEQLRRAFAAAAKLEAAERARSEVNTTSLAQAGEIKMLRQEQAMAMLDTARRVASIQ